MSTMSQAKSQGRRKDVVNLQLVRERVRSARPEPNGSALKRNGLSNWNFEHGARKTHYGRNEGNKILLERLEAENAELRDKAAELALQIQALRDGVRVGSAS